MPLWYPTRCSIRITPINRAPTRTRARTPPAEPAPQIHTILHVPYVQSRIVSNFVEPSCEVPPVKRAKRDDVASPGVAWVKLGENFGWVAGSLSSQGWNGRGCGTGVRCGLQNETTKRSRQI